MENCETWLQLTKERREIGEKKREEERNDLKASKKEERKGDELICWAGLVGCPAERVVKQQKIFAVCARE